MTRKEKKEELVSLFAVGAITIGDLIDECFEFGQHHPRWISVEDELPKKNIQVLCHGYDRRCKLGKGYMFTSFRVDKTNYYRRDGNGFIVTGVPSSFSRVTHWMQLPSIETIKNKNHET